jgi:plasmid maintenance system antidote protein VapI
MTYKDLAQRAGCSYWTICSLLTGRRSASIDLALRLEAHVHETNIFDWCFLRNKREKAKRLARLVRAAK